MALWQVDIEKQWNPGGATPLYYTNTYHVSAADAAAAQALGDAIVLIEKAVFSTFHAFTKMRVQESDPVAHSGYLTPLSGTGSRALAGEFLPLWNVVRVDFYPATGRPSRKYLRLTIQEGEQSNGNLSAAFMAIVNTGYVAPLMATSGFCDPQGQVFTRAALIPQVAMRQLRRGSRRRTAPVL